MLEQETPNIASMASLPTLSAPGLLVMDVDSTLIDEEVIDELGVAAGVGEQIERIASAHDAGSGKGQRNPGGVDSYPAPAPLLRNVSCSAGSTCRIQNNISRIATHQ